MCDKFYPENSNACTFQALGHVLDQAGAFHSLGDSSDFNLDATGPLQTLVLNPAVAVQILTLNSTVSVRILNPSVLVPLLTQMIKFGGNWSTFSTEPYVLGPDGPQSTLPSEHYHQTILALHPVGPEVWRQRAPRGAPAAASQGSVPSDGGAAGIRRPEGEQTLSPKSQTLHPTLNEGSQPPHLNFHIKSTCSEFKADMMS